MTDSAASPRPSFRDKLNRSGPRKLLALDGGGIRGLITVEILARMEKMLREEHGNDQLVLADYFDYVAGTSTGAIIATCIALGMPMTEVGKFYEENGDAMFDKSSFLKRFRYKYEDDRLAGMLRTVLREKSGESSDPTLGSEGLRTLLMMVMRNATTDSPWPLSNNPNAKYNRRDREGSKGASNLDLPLWQLVRASTAAPTYFPPEEVQVDGNRFLFVDGGITTYNNPSFLLFLMSTMGAYNLNWEPGADRMLLVSVGTGTSPDANANLAPSDMNLLYNAASIPSALMFAALNEQDLLCRVFGRCRHGAPLDREVGTLIDPPGSGPGPLPKLFTYMRYNAELTREGLAEIGVPHIEPEHVQQLDSVKFIKELKEVGQAVARQVDRAHFEGFLPGAAPS
ncbi:MAG TPA: patatin-like phospholipase family protein [Longimicrobium sp.]|nr:patatin-like phospholipase family protein [Longimicrobium sp.]